MLWRFGICGGRSSLQWGRRGHLLVLASRVNYLASRRHRVSTSAIWSGQQGVMGLLTEKDRVAVDGVARYPRARPHTTPTHFRGHLGESLHLQSPIQPLPH